MSNDPEPITEADLLAYVDGCLSADRSLEVEDYLARRPDVASRIMADLRNQAALKLLQPVTPVPRRLQAVTQKLERALIRRRVRATVPFAALMLLCVGIGWGGSDTWHYIRAREAPHLPFYVQEAVMSHNVAQVRARLVSQRETSFYDAAEIGSATQIVLPRLPNGWVVRDVQIFPSDNGPSLQVTVDSGQGEPLSLFAIRARTRAPQEPAIVKEKGANVAYWQEGDLAYALTGQVPGAELDRLATVLADEITG
ncbi:anti-sigma factor [Novosphingobium sp. BL-8H]|uniref:anti-sigma factor family protein n=1 Tax=Novosphingobium sp. BL-8H TaxID=3127640 RepID=UPI00375767CC